MSWIVYAIIAAILWGLNYTLTEQLMKTVSIATLMLAAAVCSFIFALFLGASQKGFLTDWQVLKKMSTETTFFFASIVVYIAANFFILLSIKAKNATMAGMIEITYPLFTAFFAWALFRQTQVTLGTLLGAGLIIAGVGCIYFLDKTS